MIVRWSLAELPALLAQLGLERPFLVGSPRWSLDVPAIGRWSEVPSHEIAVPVVADSLLAVGGGSAIDTAKNASAPSEQRELHLPAGFMGRETAAPRLMGGVHDLAEDVELELAMRGVADADRLRPFVAGEPRSLPTSRPSRATPRNG